MFSSFCYVFFKKLVPAARDSYVIFIPLKCFTEFKLFNVKFAILWIFNSISIFMLTFFDVEYKNQGYEAKKYTTLENPSTT